MPALYLPLPPSHPYTITNPPWPSTLLYTATHPTPTPTSSQYLVKIQTTALCRGELGWAETLSPASHASPPSSSPSPPSSRPTTTTTAQPQPDNPVLLKRIPGHDISGIVLSTPQIDERSMAGPKFKVGDEVIGLLAFARDGGAADVAVALEGELAFKPRNVSALHAACLPLSALTAWQAVFEQAGVKGWVRDGDGDGDGEEWRRDKERVRRVLVLNASGGVGVMVCQLLKADMLFGDGEGNGGGRFWVCGVCSGRNEEFVRDQLGVNEVLDYTKEREGLGAAFRKRGWAPVDFVLDCVGGQTLKQAYDAAVVRDGGIVVSIAQPVPEQEPEWADVRDAIVKRDLTSRFFIVRPDGEQLGKIALLVEGGELKSFVEREMELYQGREAMELVESGRVRGKVVLRVNNYDR
ncbi:reticulon-4-interacting protein [Histoplasma capsulatum H143]|uniref:Reticulon-4-interacting protein n=1 Tax=Ajellomyces capsulatus (strain H143) TaxID=544712 RepID=C6H7G5_AJECH|nr:reticulon-4-interacting protein [Histoplasma capsulatum H143]